MMELWFISQDKKKKTRWLACILLLILTISTGCAYSHFNVTKIESKSDETIRMRTYKGLLPETEQEYWSLANRMLQPQDFDEDWLPNGYILEIGSYLSAGSIPIEEEIGMIMCHTDKIYYRGRENQAPLCLDQQVIKFASDEAAKTYFDRWHATYNLENYWEENSAYFEIEEPNQDLEASCNIASINTRKGFHDETYNCHMKMRHGPYFSKIGVRFSLDEEPIDRQEVGELFQRAKDLMFDPRADELPVGVVAPMRFEE